METEPRTYAAPRPLSIRFTRKGALIPETYAAARAWVSHASVATNIAHIRRENLIGAKSSAWLQDVTATLAVRFRMGAGLSPLVTLAQADFPLEQWRECLLWHLGSQDSLWYAFLTDWLFAAYCAGTIALRTDDVLPFVVAHTTGRVAGGKELSAYSKVRVARDLLLMASDFALVTGRVVRGFTTYRLSDAGFLYVLHALSEHETSPQRIIESPVWRMYLLRPVDVEQTLLRLHQFQRVAYDVAGSIIQLRLPYRSLLAYAESLVL